MKSPILLLPQPQTVLANQVREFEQTALQNPFRSPMLIDEFRFWVAKDDDLTVKYRNYINYRVDIRIGREPITNGLVPVGNLSPLVQATPGPATGNFALAMNPPHQSFTWPLARPLYVPATEQLIIKASLVDPYGLTTSIKAYVACAGRSMSADEPEPEVISIPWAAAFVTTPIAAGATANFTTNPTDLGNPFNQPMCVNRFTGRCFARSDENLEPEMIGGLSARTLVSAADSFGNIVIRDPSPFSQVYFHGLRSWAPKAVLGPKGYYIFKIEQDYADYTVVGLTLNAGVSIGMLGHREVRLR